jgi:RimJ/RimL family protein N-acetyltransferase
VPGLDGEVTLPGPLPLSDDRLLLRLPEAGDVPAITEACQDPTLARWVPVPVPYDDGHARGFVESRPAAWADETTGEMTWAVTGDDRLLGMVGLHARDPGMREIGYWTAPWARGQGVMTAAARLTCRFGFEVLGLRRIAWWAGVGNDASRRVAEKVGFSMEGTCRARLPHRGERLDGWVGGLLPGELR